MSKEAWENVATVHYQDGAMIKSQINRANENVCLVLAREIDDDGTDFVVTKQQAVEIAYVMTKAVVALSEAEIEGVDNE